MNGMMKYLVWDLETRHAIGSAECPGWDDKDKMGISLGCAWKSWTAEFHFYGEEDIARLLSDMVGADVITGFNIISFDWPLILATLKRQGWRPTIDLANDIERKFYDPFADALQSLGVSRSPGGYKLDDIASRIPTLPRKNGDGREAPRLYKEGKWGELATYVCQDVKVERELFKYVCRHQSIPKPDGSLLELSGISFLLLKFPVVRELLAKQAAT